MPQSIFKIEEIQPQWLSLDKDKMIYRLVTGLILGVIFGLIIGIYFVFYYSMPLEGKPDHEINDLIKYIPIGILSGLIPGLISGLILRFSRLTRGLISGSALAISILFFYYYFDITNILKIEINEK